MRKLIILIFFLGACDKIPEPRSQEESKVPVYANPPKVENLDLYFELMGTLYPSITIDIVPQVEGEIQSVFTEEGSFVKAGAPLFKIDQARHQLKLKEALSNRGIDEAYLAAANRKLERYNRLQNKDLVAETEWDRLRTDVFLAEKKLDHDDVQIEMISHDLAKCTITSPIDGKIGKVEAVKGQMSFEKKPLCKIVQLDPLLVEFYLSEKEFQLFSGKPDLTVSLCHASICSAGKLTFIDNEFDPKTGQIILRGEIANPDFKFKPGQLVHVKVRYGSIENALLVPKKAVKYEQEGPFVYLISNDQKAVIRRIILGDERGQDIQIVEGLSEDELVISEGHLRLSPNIPVDLIQ